MATVYSGASISDSALSDQLYGDDKQHGALRHATCEQLAAYPEKYAGFVENGRPFDHYVKSMRETGTYGGHLELSAFAHAFQKNIKIVQPGLVYVVAGNDGSRGADAAQARRERARKAAVARGDKHAEAPGTLYIAYHSWEHYSSLRRTGGPHMGYPDVDSGSLEVPEPEPEPEVPTEDEAMVMRSVPGHSLAQVRALMDELGDWVAVVEALIERDSRDDHGDDGAESASPKQGSATTESEPQTRRSTRLRARAERQRRKDQQKQQRNGATSVAKTAKTPAAGPSRQPATVHDLYDWRTIAESQKTDNGYMARMDTQQWVRRRRQPPVGVLRRAARKGALLPPDAPERVVLQQQFDLALRARAYEKHWRKVLQLERALQAERVEEQRKRPVADLVAAGIALNGLHAYWQTARHFGRRVGVFKLPGGRRFPRHKFAPGNMVDIAPSDASPDWLGKESTSVPRIPAEVVSVGANVIKLRFAPEHSRLDLGAFDSWRIDEGTSTVVDERTDNAIAALQNDVDACVRMSNGDRQFALTGTSLRGMLMGDEPIEPLLFRDQRIRSWCERYMREDPIRIDGDPDLGLNAVQTRAVAMMIGRPLSLVQGPPGTGKTRTLVQAVRVLKKHFQVPHPIMLAAHTNVAVDNLAEGCLKAGMRVVRSGSTSAVRESLADATLDAHLARHAKHPQLLGLESQLRAVVEQRETLTAELNALAESHGDMGRMKELRAELKKTGNAFRTLIRSRWMLRCEIYTEVLHSADVVCCTTIASGSSKLDMIDFPIVFVDEGSMATEPTTLIPLVKGCAQLAIIGDHKQLPPVLHSVQARKQGLSTSMFERLFLQGTSEARPPVEGTEPGSYGLHGLPRIPLTMLTEQFRMHPSLASYPNAAFYGGALNDAASTQLLAPFSSSYCAYSSGAPHNVTLLTHEPCAGVAHGPAFLEHTRSPFSQSQADIVLEVICDLLDKNASLTGADIGVVTPYEAQVRLLSGMLTAASISPHGVPPGTLTEHARDALASLPAERAIELCRIEVHTVDGFEGREKPVMVFSTVKAGGGSLHGSAALYEALEQPSAESLAALDTNPTRGGYIGFLADTRRLNVALTRAQRMLIVVGNLDTLLCARLSEHREDCVEKSDVHAVRRYARWLVEHRCVVDIDAARENRARGTHTAPPRAIITPPEATAVHAASLPPL
ncbi:hypothetical protein MCUN1_003089 [Malassezia cuniculi]|uniref:Uncharacterized protein n=1 Tax=Malassezia cuniculi TaxID=948313 RepID=A0AAF0EWV7_9BASI|nr:hypothetical protein MCUN1_003089 [Malassezia cuniculi]